MLATAQEMSPEHVTPGISLTLAEHRAATISALRYEIDLAVPEARAEPLSGTVTLRFYWDDPRTLPVVIDFQEPGERVHAVAANGRRIDEPAFQNNHIVIPAELLRPHEENTIEISILAGDGPLNRQDDFFYTLFVPDRAHHALPVFDQPDLKGRFSVSLEVPAGWEAVANGRRVAEESAPDGRRRYTFAETAPISTYLLAFTAGEYQRVEREVGDHPLVLYHRETDADRVSDNLDAIFDLHATSLDWLEDYTGIPYPFDLFELVAIPSFQYNGMEHPGAVYYRASSLFLEPSATQNQILGRASLIAHETAHMWFGDLVTMRWFDDVWTKEVYANFFAAKIVNPSFPEVDHNLRFLLSHHPAAYAIDRSRGANPIRQPLENLNEAGALYGPIIYQKAPIVMRQLERLVGEEVFRSGIQRYLERFAFGNATWPALISILDELTEHDLARWSEVWVEESGRPIVEVDRDGDGFVLAAHDPARRGRVWTQTLDPVAGRADGVQALSPVRLGAEPQIHPVDGDVAWLLPDAEGYGYALFRLDDASRRALLRDLPTIEAPLTRAVALLTLWDATLEGELAPQDLLDLLVERAANEPDEQVLARVLSLLGSTYWSLLCPDERRRWAARIEPVLIERLEGEAPATMKAALFEALRSIALTPRGIETLRQVWAGERSISSFTIGETDRTATALALALREVHGWESILEDEEAAIQNSERRERFRFLQLSVHADAAVREGFFETLRLRGNRSREAWVQTGLGYLNHPLRGEHATRFIRPSLEMLEEIQRTGDIFFPQGWMGGALSGHTSAEAVAIVEGFLAERPDYPPRLREKILQALDMTERAERITTCEGEGDRE